MARSTGKSHFERFHAAIASDDDERAEELVSLLTSKDQDALLSLGERAPNLRWWVLRSLAAVGDEQAVPSLLAAAEETESDLRTVAALSLAELSLRHPDRLETVLPTLGGLLHDEDGLVRQVAADALARLGDDAVPLLKDALDDEHEGVRVRAARALQRVGTMATALPLYHHLDDSSPLVRHYAYEALSDLGLLTDTYFTPE